MKASETFAVEVWPSAPPPTEPEATERPRVADLALGAAVDALIHGPLDDLVGFVAPEAPVGETRSASPSASVRIRTRDGEIVLEVPCESRGTALLLYEKVRQDLLEMEIDGFVKRYGIEALTSAPKSTDPWEGATWSGDA